MEALGQRLSDPRERLLRWSVLAFFGISAFMAGWPLPYTLAVPARLEPQVETAVVAPADAVVLSSLVKVGDMVQSGQPLVRLSPAPSLRQRDALREQLLRVDTSLHSALQQGDGQSADRWQDVRTDLQHRLDALKDVEAMTLVRAPFDGVVVRAGEAGGAGSQVLRGDALWVVSPGLDWRVVLEVGEGDVASLKPGQRASLRLASEPGRSVNLLLKRPVPAAVTRDASVHFDVDAQPSGGAMAGLRPGQRGMAHIDMPPRPVLWRAVDSLRAWWWVAVWGLW
jgi:multidrug efflux pump subunit AcrA (membrane-fusion protein)